MVHILFKEHDGTEHPVEAETGSSLMRAAIDNGVPGIDADCGGACSCATCHVFVDENYLGKLSPISDAEEAMLGLSNDRQENSRLACQITLTEELDGIVATTPEFQF